jgi:hypothetical protein
VDENKLAELFNDAVRDAPPASFDVGSVRAGSHRATVRQRSAIALGSTMAAVVVFGGVALGIGGFGMSTTSAGVAISGSDKGAEQPAAPYAQSTPGSSVERGQQPDIQSFPEGSSTQGVGPSGNVSPPADGTPGGCGTVDRELANALAGELPVASYLAAPAGVVCPDGSKSASFDVDGGRVYAIVVPPNGPTLSKQPGVNQASKFAKSKSTVYVVSESPVFADRVDAIAADLAEQF